MKNQLHLPKSSRSLSISRDNQPTSVLFDGGDAIKQHPISRENSKGATFRCGLGFLETLLRIQDS
ncbi:hypothetical protein Hanom_Chr11g01030211 [Helianthus anomalus]